MIIIEYHSVAIIFQQDSVVLWTVIYSTIRYHWTVQRIQNTFQNINKKTIRMPFKYHWPLHPLGPFKYHSKNIKKTMVFEGYLNGIWMLFFVTVCHRRWYHGPQTTRSLYRMMYLCVYGMHSSSPQAARVLGHCDISFRQTYYCYV